MEEKKKRVNSKSKGNGFELKVANLLSKELNPLKFIRVPGSGAFVGGKNFASRHGLFSQESMKIFVGDVVCTNEEECNQGKFRFVIECKAYKTPEKMDLLLSGKSNIYKWLDEVHIDCVKINKEGILIFKWNNCPLYAAVDKHIELPVPFLTLPNGEKVCYFQELLKFKQFWII